MTLISRPKNPGDYTQRLLWCHQDFADFMRLDQQEIHYCYLLFLTLRYCTWINTELHLADIFLFYDGCLKFSFQVWSCILDIQRFLACCLKNMLLCHYLIPKECGDSKVLFSKLQLATYIYSIHYIFPFKFILGYIVRRLVIIITIIINIIID